MNGQWHRLREIVRKVESGERCWPAEIVLRGFGLALLALGAWAVSWLYRSFNPAPHVAGLADDAAAVLAVLCWWFGWAFAILGPALFKRIPLPARHWYY
jgi:hypothetical protein